MRRASRARSTVAHQAARAVLASILASACLVTGSASIARAGVISAGASLTTPPAQTGPVRHSARLDLEQKRLVWIQAQYWDCKQEPPGAKAPPGVTVIKLVGGELFCTFVFNHWAVVPDGEACRTVLLDSNLPPYPVTVCGAASVPSERPAGRSAAVR